jgi:hypothetical protein
MKLKSWSMVAISMVFLGMGGCGVAPGPKPVHKSLYLNKKLVKFVIDNGAPYRRVTLKNGRTLHYWRSDFGKLIAIAMGRDDNFPDYCELALETDPNQIVQKIYIIEESFLCNTVLK